MSRKRQKTSNFDVGGNPTTSNTNTILNKHITFTHNLLHSDKSTYSNAYFYNNIKHKGKLLSNRFLNTSIPLLGSTLALLIVVGLVCPVGLHFSSEVYAESITNQVDDYSSISFSISHNGTELNTDGAVSTEVTPGLVSYIDNDINITTQNIEKFYITVQATSDGTSELIGTISRATIAPVGNKVSPNNLGENTWGYAISDANASSETLLYSSLPSYSASIAPQYTSAAGLADGNYRVKLAFAARITANKPSDHYTTKAMVSVVADAKAATWENIKYMQQMNTSVCNEAGTNGSSDTKQLIDKRDGKTYWVAKLKDGNCWMTQNLDLDLYVDGKGRTLTSEDSDVANWTSTTGASATWSDTGNNIIKYYDPGNKYCTGSNCNATSSSNGGHDHQGNYYSFNTATAGTGASVTTGGQNAPSSICPKGWQLPTSNNTNSKSFGKLVSDYSIGSNGAKLLAAPLYFIYGGYVYSGSLNAAGSNCYYWSSTAYSSSAAYSLGFNSSNVYPSTNNLRYNGYSIRCVAR